MSFYSGEFTHLKVKKENDILWVNFNLPEKRNAITIPMIESFTSVLNHADWDQEIKIIIIS